MPRKASEQGACKDLKGHISTIGSGNKSKDRGMLQTSKERMSTYIGTKFGDDAAQEWTREKQIALKSQSTPTSFWIGTARGSMPPTTELLSRSPA